MDENSTEIEIVCFSEKTNDSIGCGIMVPSIDPAATDITITINDPAVFEASLEESFWELIGGFEDSAQKAFDKGEISGTNQDELFKVFGHFSFSCTMGDKPIHVDLIVDPDEFMYPRLEEYLEIDME